MQKSYEEQACRGINGKANKSIPWMKAMCIEYMRRVIEDDICSTLLAIGEKILMVTYDHPKARSSDLCRKLVKYEINCSQKAMKFLAKIDDKESRYDFYFDSDR